MAKREDQPDDDLGTPEERQRAAQAFARRGTTTTRVRALVADAGLACQFQPILSSDGAPFAEMAALHASSGEHTHGERTILRAAGFADLVKASSAFRRRAAFEFAQAPGLPVSTRLYLPYYCCMKEVEQTGPPLFDIISEARLHPSRVIVELLSPPAGVGASAEHLEPLRARGVALSLRVADAEDAHLETSDALNPSYVHVTRPPGSYDEIGRYKSFCSALLERGVRLVLGGIDRGEDASLAEGLGASLFAGDAIAPARFLV